LYKFRRQFSADVGEPSIMRKGPDSIERDIDELGKYFDPDSFHDDGSPGGIYIENIGGNILNPMPGETTLPELIASKVINGLTDKDGNTPQQIWPQMNSIYAELTKHEALRAIGGTPHGIRIFRDMEMGPIIQFLNEQGAWEVPVVQAAGYSQTLADRLDVTSPGTLALDARQGSVLLGKIDAIPSQIQGAINSAFDNSYPVGSIYMTTVDKAPYRGTWVKWGAGRVPIGVNTADTDFATVEKTGGAKTVTLAVANMPSHAHTSAVHAHNYNYGHSHGITNDYPNMTIPCVLSTNVNIQARHVVTGGTGMSVLAFSDNAEYSVVERQMTAPAGTAGSVTESTTPSGTGLSGTGTAFNNLQPYITCFMFKRTA